MRLSRRQLIGSAAGIAAVAAGVATAEALGGDRGGGSPDLRTSPTARGTRFPGDPGRGRLFYGASVMPGLSVSALELALDHRLTLQRSYFDPTEKDALVSQVADDHAAARLPVVSIKLPGTWAQVAAGDDGGWLLDLLDRLGAADGPVMLSLHHEPEDDVGGVGMTAVDWVAMQRRAIGAAQGKRITILPVLMAWTFLPQSGRNPAEWWVSDADVMGIDCYNPWSPDTPDVWSTFEERMTPARAYAPETPLLVAEYGCRTPPDDPERAATWIRDAFEYAVANDIIGMAYFDSSLNSPDGSWILDHVRTRAMRECIGRPQVVQLA
jgi:hypothetical protein